MFLTDCGNQVDLRRKGVNIHDDAWRPAAFPLIEKPVLMTLVLTRGSDTRLAAGCAAVRHVAKAGESRSYSAVEFGGDPPST